MKFSREFDAYLPIQQSLVRISSQNSRENFKAILSFKTCEAVSFIVLPPYADVKK